MSKVRKPASRTEDSYSNPTPWCCRNRYKRKALYPEEIQGSDARLKLYVNCLNEGGPLLLADIILAANRDRDPDAMTAGALKAGLEEVNKLFKGVQAPAEAILDSDYLRLTGEMAMYQARKIKIGSDYFDTDDFITKLKSATIGNLVRQANGGAGSQRNAEAEEQDYDGVVADPYVGWDRIGKLATKHSLRVPPIDFM